MKMIERPLHPWLFAAYPLMELAASNFGQVPLLSLFSALAGTWIALTLISPLATKICGGWTRGALFLSLFVLFFFTYGRIHGELDTFARQTLVTGTERLGGFLLQAGHLWLSAVALLLLTLALLLLRRLPMLGSPRLSGALNVAALFLLVSVAVQAGIAWRQALDGEVAGTADRDRPQGRDLSVLGYNPDIYYIILDGYARADVLRDYYAHDNEPFLQALRDRGFSVAQRSRVNYNWTFLSLASALNFDYLQSFMADALPRDQNGRGPVYQAVRDNRVASYLRNRGYRIVHLKSSWGATLQNPYADEQVGCGGSLFDDEYLRTLVEISWLKVNEQGASADLAACHLGRLRALAAQAKRPGPKFVFAHFLPPHHPYLFDSKGNVLRKVTISNQFDFQARLWERRDAYLEQLKFVNKTMIETVDGLLENSERPPIIIIQSDHGPGLGNGLTPKQWEYVRLSNLMAVHFPGAPAELIPQNSGPVNLYRHLFNHYFQANLPILPERSFVSPYGRPYAFQEVR